MAEITKELGRIPVSRGDYQATVEYYKDNIVQYKRGSYQVVSESPIIGVPPTNDKNVVNPGWTLFAGILDAQDVVNQIKEQEAQSIQAVAAREAEILAKSDAAEVSFDNTGTSLSETNVQDALKKTDGKLSKLESEVIYDVTANNDSATFPSLSALLSSENLSTLIPTSVRHGGMSIRFVQSSDNNYVQYFLVNNQWSTMEADWEKINLDKEVNSSPAYYDRTDFLSENLYVGDIGVHARILPTNEHSEIKSQKYRYIWVKVLAGDSIHTYAAGYTDNVSIGFSIDRSFSNFTVLDATSGTKERSAVASSDGYFFVGFIYMLNEELLNTKIWCAISKQECSLVGNEIGSNNIHLVASINQTGTISYSETQTTLIYKVQKGDVISSKVRQYGDTAAIFFSTNYPSVGGSAKCLVVGVTADTTPLTLQEATAPDDGYVGITYLNTLSSPIAEQKVFTDEPLYYDYNRFEYLTNSIVTKKEIDISIDDAIDIKNIQAVGTTNQIVTVASKNVQTSLIYKIRKGETIKAIIRQYLDTASVSFSENIPVVGSNVKVLDVGTLDTSTKEVQGTAPTDGYIMLTYLNSKQDPISGIKLVCQIYNYDYEIKEIDRQIDRIDHIKDFRSAIHFMSAQMESGSSMQNWTGQDVINNIYEPLRTSHPEYITRRSLGKDPTNTYDIWLYEFNNNVDELFGIQQKTSFVSDIILPEENGLSAKQCAIKKTTFDEFFADVQYKNIYFLVSFAVRKLEAWSSKVETIINNETYYVFTFDSDVAITIVGEQSALEVWWTKAVKTYDQHCMIISGVHADEMSGYIGTGLALKYLVENHANNPSLDYIYNHVKLSVVPIFNVWGANQSPKSRTDYYGNQTNSWVAGSLTHEQQIVADYVESVKDELSFFVDFHTSELWNNYGFVYAITIPHVTLYPAIVAAANYLCKHWFPNLPPYNWNIGGPSPTSGTIYSVKYMYNTFGVQGSVIESCGKDLMAFGNCEKWSAKYMTYVVENYLNFMLAICNIRIKNNSKNIEENDIFVRDVML